MQLAAAHVRVFSVGLQSPAFDPAPLQQLASATGGKYVLATGPTQLRPILVALGRRLSNEYLVTYQSHSEPGDEGRRQRHGEGLRGLGIARVLDARLCTRSPLRRTRRRRRTR